MQAMITANGNLLAFFGRPIAATLGATCVLFWLTPVVKAVLGKVRPATGAAASSGGGPCAT